MPNFAPASCSGVCWSCSVSGTARRKRRLIFDALDRFISEQMVTNRVPGLALAITRGDKSLYIKGYGTARSGQPVTSETQFFIASA